MQKAEVAKERVHPSVWRYARSGAIAGVASVLVFTVIHYFTISNIWNMFFIMSAAGVLCGVCLAWSFVLVVEEPSSRSWIAYNGWYVSMMVLLGVTSVLVFEPVTTIPALMLDSQPPDELFREAMPMTVGFLLTFSVVMSLIYRRSLKGYGILLLTSTVLVLFLGLNVSVIGLVFVPRGSLHLIGELFALILALGLIYVTAFVGLEWKSLVRGSDR